MAESFLINVLLCPFHSLDLSSHSKLKSWDIHAILTAMFYFSVQTTKTGPNSYFLCLNGSFKEVEMHRLADGSLLLSVDGASYTTYMKEEVDRYRVVIGNQTCIFEKENDPTILRTPSAGKLLGFMVEEGGHVQVHAAHLRLTFTRFEPFTTMSKRKEACEIPTSKMICNSDEHIDFDGLGYETGRPSLRRD